MHLGKVSGGFGVVFGMDFVILGVIWVPSFVGKRPEIQLFESFSRQHFFFESLSGYQNFATHIHDFLKVFLPTQKNWLSFFGILF